MHKSSSGVPEGEFVNYETGQEFTSVPSNPSPWDSQVFAKVVLTLVC